MLNMNLWVSEQETEVQHH